ncbi:DUF2887 domain-containing protein [Thermosynechococcaceae cyanobacterium BACA0444]|uniref:DUF2887 domain-containing protein n=1 Tax=Pseudocalidococcus azoricus BACA0444 TaxID=2918990 RepID=A0AAE4FQT4_9CYAN|nr:DUF2887 domain-containing protein [Pseudocalidococcus azoricus]MDS3859266.1 DUF2887 domain-containing protein [Pseudocalidococcus azoricus BACA0444]
MFELLDDKPSNAAEYRFESVTVKETAFQLDSVFLPPPETRPGPVYFLEIQCQKDEQFYERFFGELFIFLYRHCEIVTLLNYYRTIYKCIIYTFMNRIKGI